MKRTFLTGASAALLLTVTACGGGSSGGGSSSGGSSSNGDDQKAAAAISAGVMKLQNSTTGAGPLTVDRKGADCFGKGIVDEVGVAQLKKYGVLTDDLKTGKDITKLAMSAKDAKASADVLANCVDLESSIKKALASQVGKLDPKVRRCLDRVLTEQAMHGVFVEIFEGNSQRAGGKLVAALRDCVTPSAG